VDLFLASSHDLPIVTQAETVENYQVLRDDLVLIGTASYVVELLDRFTYEEGENTGIYNLLVETLSRLASGMPPALVVRYYELRLLDFTGFRPNLFTCVRCENDIQAQDQFFSFDEGGVLCPGCGAGLPGALPVSLTALKYLRHLQRSSFSEARKSGIKPEVQPEIENLLQRYITHILERRLNSPGFLRLVRNQEQAGKTGTSVAQGNAPNPLEPVNPGDVRQ
jgi:DNA repair protein RecO (recombination protein O)